MAKYKSSDERVTNKVKEMLNGKKSKKSKYKNGKSQLHSGGKLHKGYKK